jgi:hypothetical protein
VPAGRIPTPVLGWACAVLPVDELGDVGLAFAVDAGDDDVDVDVEDVELDDDVPEIAVLEAAPAAELELGLDDPPQAASSSTSEPSPLAAAHPLFRITSLSLQGPRHPGPYEFSRELSRWTRHWPSS